MRAFFFYLRRYKFLFSFAFSLTITPCFSQPTPCPDNIDFEHGDFSNWTCGIGEVYSFNGVTDFNWFSDLQYPTYHTIVNSGTDPFGLFPRTAPNGSGYSVKLGSERPLNKAERIYYTYSIPANVSNFSLTYYVAIVLRFSETHTPAEQPRFIAKITDMSTGSLIECGSMEISYLTSASSFQVSPVNDKIAFKDWTPVSVNLTQYAGKTIRIEFSANDCTIHPSRDQPHTVHWSYAYVDVNASCSSAVTGNYICPRDTSITLTAPLGYQHYIWYSDTTFTQAVGFDPSLYINPVPPVGSIHPVIVTGLAGFTCRDTIYTKILTAPEPPSDAGPDKITCSNVPIQIGAPANPNYTYSWMPDTLVNAPLISNPYTNRLSAPTDFIVKTRDRVTGCYSYDTALVIPKLVDTSVTMTGKPNYCAGETINNSLTVNNISSTVQWYKNNVPISGATNLSYGVTLPGTYRALIANNSCVDSSRVFRIRMGSIPQVNFHPDKDSQCVDNGFPLINTTFIPGNEPVTYVWKFSDGTSSIIPNPRIVFPAVGVYTAKLIATASESCKDSIEKSIPVFPNAFPDFVNEPVCANNVIQFLNLTNENGASQVKYHWDFGNGGKSDQKIPASFKYAFGGKYTVELRTVAPGCENAPQMAAKFVYVKNPKPGINYGIKGVVEGVPVQLKARDHIGSYYQWQPHVQLSDYAIQDPMLQPVSDVQYFISITDSSNCRTIDTISIKVMKKAGNYLPSAFTPNGDGLNDVITPFLAGMKELKRFSIYNKYGNVVFSTTREGEGWDGTVKGVKLDSGVFVWQLEFINNDNKVIFEKGFITLIR